MRRAILGLALCFVPSSIGAQEPRFPPFMDACMRSGGQAGYVDANGSNGEKTIYIGDVAAKVTVSFWSLYPQLLTEVRYSTVLPATSPKKQFVGGTDSFSVLAKFVAFTPNFSNLPGQIFWCSRVN